MFHYFSPQFVRESISGQTEPVEWQTDEFGRRYRMNGIVKEYEMMIETSNGVIPESQLEEHNRRMNAKNEIAQEKRVVHCPLSSSLSRLCKSDCAFYNDGCSMARLRDEAAVDTKGKTCPITNYPCDTDCALYKNGCILTA